MIPGGLTYIMVKIGVAIRTYGTTITGTVNNTIGTAASGTNGSITSLGNGMSVAAWTDGATMYAVVVTTTVSGTTVTDSYGPVLTITTSNAGSTPRIGTLDSGRVLLAYAGTSVYATAVVLSVSGDTLTKGTPVVIKVGTEQVYQPIMSIAVLSPTLALVAWGANGGFDNYDIRAVNVSGTTVTVGGYTTLGSGAIANSYGLYMAPATSTTAGAVWLNSGNTYTASAMFTVNGSTVTKGTTTGNMLTTAYNAKTFAKLTDTVGLFTGVTGTGQLFAATVVLGATLTVISSVTGPSLAMYSGGTGTGLCQIAVLSPTRAVVCYCYYNSQTRIDAVPITIQPDNSLVLGTQQTVYNGDNVSSISVAATSDQTVSILRTRTSAVGGSPASVISFLIP